MKKPDYDHPETIALITFGGVVHRVVIFVRPEGNVEGELSAADGAA